MEKTLLKGLQLLEALAMSDHPRGVTDLAQELNLTKSNVHRLLNTLLRLGFVQKNTSRGLYCCTLKLWELGVLLLERLEIRSVARPHMVRLAEKTKETVHLSILDGTEIIYLDKIDSPQPVRAYSTVGGRAPAHCVATGKAMLAQLPDKQISIVQKGGKKFTNATITDEMNFVKEIKIIREKGYAINIGEWRSSVGGIAAPIFDAQQRLHAAIGISGPIVRLTPEIMPTVAVSVVGAAKAISRELGFLE
jgi:IclR family KDG regulon transcriptional repressor